MGKFVIITGKVSSMEYETSAQAYRTLFNDAIIGLESNHEYMRSVGLNVKQNLMVMKALHRVGRVQDIIKVLEDMPELNYHGAMVKEL